ncbi:uncharacterized protein LOC133863077 [Alnus glutinosa]|uniref:uncharacterized protein LOC133863077 n=1 Tax=Alnus glutinosa TaxID=3517 RepID=UPI002D7888BA|nr:uncharacterized protein LOC133863077 [Alnus glutinosa]
MAATEPILPEISRSDVFSSSQRRPDLPTIEMAATEPIPPEISRRDSFSSSQRRPERNSTSDVRNAHLVVAALVAATAFQVAVNPPGGVWQDDKLVATNETKVRHAGKAIMASSNPNEYIAFVFFNSMAFSSSVIAIIFQTANLPYFRLSYMALVSMLVTYGYSVRAVTPPCHTWHCAHRYVIISYFLSLVINAMVGKIKNCMGNKNEGEHSEQGGEE